MGVGPVPDSITISEEGKKRRARALAKNKKETTQAKETVSKAKTWVNKQVATAKKLRETISGY